MAIEIERKFLVRDESWRPHVDRHVEIRDGLIAITDTRKVRVRICDNRTATLTVKSKTESLANAEFEYGIPLSDAEELMAHHCVGPELAKTRYFVPHGERMWQVDVYAGILDGVILAEVELPTEATEVALPPWVSREVTGDAEYKKFNMVRARSPANAK